MSDTPISNTPMSATPRTDEIPHNVAELAMHARKLEREIRQLEVAIYDLKTENNLLNEALDQVIEDRDAYHDENAKLRKDADELILLNQAVTMLAGSPRSDEMDALIKKAKDEGYNQGLREGLESILTTTTQ